MAQELAANHNSHITLAASSSVNDDDSYYVESRNNLPTRSYNSPELETFIEEIMQMHDEFNTALEVFPTPRALFAHLH